MKKAPRRRRFFITAGASPRPTLNYRKGAPMCAPVIHGTGFIPLPSPAVTPSPLGRLTLREGFFAERSRPFPTVYRRFIKNTAVADIIHSFFRLIRGGIFYHGGSKPPPYIKSP